MKRYGKCCEKYEIIINGKGLPVQKKKKKGIRRVLLTTCNKSLPCVQPPPPLKQNRGKGPSPRFQGYFFKIPRRRRQRERQKSNTLNRQKNNFASA